VSFILVLPSFFAIEQRRETPYTFRGFIKDTFPTIIQKFLKNQGERCEILPSCPVQVKGTSCKPALWKTE
jgi:hypothetical protein